MSKFLPETGLMVRTSIANTAEDCREAGRRQVQTVLEKRLLIKASLRTLGYSEPFRVGGRLVDAMTGQADLDCAISRLTKMLGSHAEDILVASA